MTITSPNQTSKVALGNQNNLPAPPCARRAKLAPAKAGEPLRAGNYLFLLLLILQQCSGQVWFSSSAGQRQLSPAGVLRTLQASPANAAWVKAGRAEDAGEFYRVTGRKIRLLRSLEKVAVRYAPSQRPAIMSRLEAVQEPARRYRIDREAADLGIVVLQTERFESLNELTESIRQLEQSTGVTRVAPVYISEQSGLELIPTGELIVKLTAGANLAELLAINKRTGATLVRRLRGTTDQYILALPYSTAEELLAACEDYRQDPAIEWAEPDFLSEVIKYGIIPNDPLFDPNQWNLSRISAPGAWDITTGSDQVIIAIIDDGMELTHEDLYQNLPSNSNEIAANAVDDDGNGYIDDVNGWDFVDDDADPSPADPADSHGTTLAGVAAAKGNNQVGIAGCVFDCRLMPLKVIKGHGLTTDRVAEALYYAAGFSQDGSRRWRGADVICISLGFEQSNAVNWALEAAAIQGRGGKGCPIFCAAGNEASGYEWYAKDTPKLPPGAYVIEFDYYKDYGGTDGNDCVWIANVVLPDKQQTRERFDSPLMPSGWSGQGGAGFTIVDDPAHAFGTGRYVARSGKTGDSSNSILVTADFILVPGNEFSFYAWVSSEKGTDTSISYPPTGDDGDWLFVWFRNVYTGTYEAGYLIDAGVPGDRRFERGYPVSTSSSYPACHELTIAVGASSYYDYRCDYSGYPPEFVAPGGDDPHYIMTTDRMGDAGYANQNDDPCNYTFSSGTSLAAPLAAGVGALMLSADAGLTAEEIRLIMRRNCNKIGGVPYDANGWNQYYGYGRINAQKTLADMLPSPPRVDNVETSTPMNMPTTITLQAIDDGKPDPPGALTCIITLLPAHGSLKDPNAQTIQSVPYSLVENGNQVIYYPDSGYAGADSFTFKANDGGEPPDGGDSGQATVAISVYEEKTVQYQVGSSEDDGYAAGSAEDQHLLADRLIVGRLASDFTAGMRFTNVDIPKGAEIREAYLEIRAFEGQTGTVDGKIQAEASDNPGAFSAARHVAALPKTSASAVWDHSAPWAADTWYRSGDISSVIQEVVDRSGWSAGNALVIFYSGRTESSSWRWFSSYDSPPAGQYAPRLQVTYKVTLPAVIISAPLAKATVGQLYRYDVEATGIPSPTYSLLSYPEGMTIDETTGLIEWTPTEAQLGSHPVSVRAANPAGLDEQSFTVTVTGPSEPPKITSTPPSEAEVGQTYVYDVNAGGIPEPTYVLIDAPQGMTIDQTTGLIQWTPEASQSGTNEVTVRAANSAGTDSQSFTITVSGVAPGLVTMKVVACLEPTDCAVTTAPENWPAYYERQMFYLELWAQITQPPADSNGLSCVFGDVTFDSNMVSAESMDHCASFATFAGGTIEPNLVDELGGCTLVSGLGITPQWALIARVKMTARREGQTDISLASAGTGCSIIGYGVIPTDQIRFESCQVTVGDMPETCLYDLDGDNSIGPGDLALFACCWQHPASDSGCNGQIPCADCDFDCDGSVGPGDLAWFATAWSKPCDHASIQWPPCRGGQTTASEFSSQPLQPLASDVELRPVILAAPSLSDATETLPPSVSSVSKGQDYYVEVWASDKGSTNTGLTSVYVDMRLAPSDAVSVQQIDHGGVFTMFESGTIESWGTAELGGSCITPVGVEPQWVRAAVVKIRANASGVISCSLAPSKTGIASLGRGLISRFETAFGEYECFPGSYSTYNDWVALGRPACWCGPYQCDGDTDGVAETVLQYRIYTDDLALIVQNWKKQLGDPTLNPCADIDHQAETLSGYRVYGNDLNTVVTNWKKRDRDLLGDCPRPQ